MPCRYGYGIKFLGYSKKFMNAHRNNNRADANAREMNSNRMERQSSAPNDLPDSKEDQEKLQPEESFIDLPDVKDIPGQEFVKAPPAGALGDTTISSDDEEGRSVFERDDEDLRRTGTNADVGRDERRALEQVDYMPTTDENNLQNARMDNVDFQNEPLNEKGFGEERSGRDLDVPGSKDKTGGDGNDNVTESTQ
jgi:hypothetical protein